MKPFVIMCATVNDTVHRIWYLLADKKECEEERCLKGGTSLDGINAYTCQCVDGRTGNDCSYSMRILIWASVCQTRVEIMECVWNNRVE